MEQAGCRSLRGAPPGPTSTTAVLVRVCRADYSSSTGRGVATSVSMTVRPDGPDVG